MVGLFLSLSAFANIEFYEWKFPFIRLEPKIYENLHVIIKNNKCLREGAIPIYKTATISGYFATHNIYDEDVDNDEKTYYTIKLPILIPKKITFVVPYILENCLPKVMLNKKQMYLSNITMDQEQTNMLCWSSEDYYIVYDVIFNSYQKKRENNIIKVSYKQDLVRTDKGDLFSYIPILTYLDYLKCNNLITSKVQSDFFKIKIASKYRVINLISRNKNILRNDLNIVELSPNHQEIIEVLVN